MHKEINKLLRHVIIDLMGGGSYTSLMLSVHDFKSFQEMRHGLADPSTTSEKVNLFDGKRSYPITITQSTSIKPNKYKLL